MHSSEHVAQAIIHLEKAANANHDHLLREQRTSEWHREVLASARASAARAILTEVHAGGLRQQNHGQYLISDTLEMNAESSYWTDNQANAQVYYNLEHAFTCAGRLASIVDQDIEVVELD